jgi:hypothetical protein
MKLDIKTLQALEDRFGPLDLDQTISQTPELYIRFGYWHRVDLDALKALLPGVGVEEYTLDDDDTRTIYSYRINLNAGVYGTV